MREVCASCYSVRQTVLTRGSFQARCPALRLTQFPPRRPLFGCPREAVSRALSSEVTRLRSTGPRRVKGDEARLCSSWTKTVPVTHSGPARTALFVVALQTSSSLQAVLRPGGAPSSADRLRVFPKPRHFGQPRLRVATLRLFPTFAQRRPGNWHGAAASGGLSPNQVYVSSWLSILTTESKPQILLGLLCT